MVLFTSGVEASGRSRGHAGARDTHGFLHRDFHPGNLLWEGGQIRGIVDWAFACQGPVAVDVAHTRCNLMMVDGLEAAERFLVEYKVANHSYEHHSWWDAAELLTWDDEFSGVMAFNAFGAGLDLQLLSSQLNLRPTR